jgi:hypothetical protein
LVLSLEPTERKDRMATTNGFGTTIGTVAVAGDSTPLRRMLIQQTSVLQMEMGSK